MGPNGAILVPPALAGTPTAGLRWLPKSRIRRWPKAALALRSEGIKGPFILPPSRTCSLSVANEMLARMNYLAPNGHKEILNNAWPLEF